MESKNFAFLLLCILVCLLAGFIGSIVTTPAITEWYTELNKPWFNPPNWVFGPVWTILYVLMGISLYLVLKDGINYKNRKGFYLFGVQISLNILWSIIFFGLRSPFLAFVEILLLLVVLILTIAEFRKIDKRAAWILLPYLLWVTFAAFLNFWVWRLNLF